MSCSREKDVELCAAEGEIFNVAGLYASEAEKMLEEVARHFGTKEFVSVHVRVEADWEEHCAASKDRNDPQTALYNNNYQCWVNIRLSSASTTASKVPSVDEKGCRF